MYMCTYVCISPPPPFSLMLPHINKYMYIYIIYLHTYNTDMITLEPPIEPLSKMCDQQEIGNKQFYVFVYIYIYKYDICIHRYIYC